MVVVEFQLEVKINEASQEARAKINAIRGDLPQGIEEPIIQKLDFSAIPVVSVAVRSETFSPQQLTTLVEKRVKRRFENLPGVGKVDMVGQSKREVNVDIHPSRLEAIGMGVDEVIVCVEHLDQVQFFQLLRSCLESGAGVKVSSPLYAVIPEHLDIEKYGNVGVVTISQAGPSKAYEFYKRAFDTVVAAIGMFLLAPVFGGIALLIKLDSKGPVLYTQVRVGRNGRQFNFFKFRSMRVGSDSDLNREQQYAKLIRGEWKGSDAEAPTKIIDASRVTPVGAFLRKTSLDELPQLLNVLRGDMSLVGPRPCLPYEWKHYQEWHKQRLSVMPGCTGVWQVFGRSRVGFQDMVILDLYYSQSASFGLDLWLLFKTIPVMLLGRGGK
jgi:lipopolysaccharide/colanic/teichoic acid biosynthesis glycosyltransferase